MNSAKKKKSKQTKAEATSVASAFLFSIGLSR